MSAMTLALSKGRLLEETLPILAAAGIRPVEDPLRTRRLILETSDPGLRLLIIRAADVPTYVHYGAADLGVSGKDVLIEHGAEGMYEPLDLGIGRCRIAVAGPPETRPQTRRLRIATKYVHITEQYYAARGEQVDIVKLYGSMELAPLLGLADRIVDLVSTGATLKANGLVIYDTLMEVSARLVVNKAAMKMRHAEIKGLLRRFETARQASLV